MSTYENYDDFELGETEETIFAFLAFSLCGVLTRRKGQKLVAGASIAVSAETQLRPGVQNETMFKQTKKGL